MLQMSRVIFSVEANKTSLNPREPPWDYAKLLVHEERVHARGVATWNENPKQSSSAL